MKPKTLFHLIAPEWQGMTVEEARAIILRAINLHAGVIVSLRPNAERDYHTAYARKLNRLLKVLDGLPSWLTVPVWARHALEDQEPASDALLTLLRVRQWDRAVNHDRLLRRYAHSGY